MSPGVRRVLAVVAGAVVAVAVVSLSDGLVGRAYPLPEGTDMRDAESMRAAFAAMPLPAMLLLLAGWALAAGIGAFVAVRLTADRRIGAGLIVTVILLLATLANLAALPHPVWMWPAAIVLVPLVGWLGARAGSRQRRVGEAS